MAAKEALAVSQKQSIAEAAAALINAEDFVYVDAGTSTLAMVRALNGPALEAHYVTNGIAHARAAGAEKLPCLPAGRAAAPQNRGHHRRSGCHGAAAVQFYQGIYGGQRRAMEAGFTTPDPEEAAVKAAAIRRARQIWFLTDDSKFGRIYPAVIGAWRCRDPDQSLP